MRGPGAPRRHSAADTPGLIPLVLGMLGLVVLGGPLVFALWTAVNHLLYGDPGAVRWSVALPALAGFALLLGLLPRVLRAWGAEPHARPPTDLEESQSP